MSENCILSWLWTWVRTAFFRGCGQEWDLHFVVAVDMSENCILSWLWTWVRTAFCRGCGHEWDLHFVVAVDMSETCILYVRLAMLRCTFLHCRGHYVFICFACLWTAMRSTFYRDYVSSCLLTLSMPTFCHASRNVESLWGHLINFHARQGLCGSIRTSCTRCNVRCLGGETNPRSLEHETYVSFRLM